ncbi:unnamed protein product, partial [Prorocentrum cordatum]
EPHENTRQTAERVLKEMLKIKAATANESDEREMTPVPAGGCQCRCRCSMARSAHRRGTDLKVVRRRAPKAKMMGGGRDRESGFLISQAALVAPRASGSPRRRETVESAGVWEHRPLSSADAVGRIDE